MTNIEKSHFRLNNQLQSEWRYTIAAMVIVTSIGCVDVSPPWNKVAGAGGIRGAGGADASIAGEAAETGRDELGSMSSGGAMGAPDVPALPLVDSDGSGGEPKTPPPGSGGSLVASTPPATGGIAGGGGSNTGGTPGSGGIAASGGSSGASGADGRDATNAPIDQGASEATPASTLAVYYACDRAEGNRLTDGSGNDRHALLVGDPDRAKPVFSFSPDRIGNALRLLASGRTHAEIPVNVFAGARELTLAAWVQVTKAQGWQRILDVGINAHLSQNDVPTTVYMALVAQDAASHLQFMISKSGMGGTQRITGPALPVGSWKHVAVVLGPQQVVLYVDGSVAATDSSVILRPADLGTVDYAYIGMSQFSVDPYFEGMIDEFRVYRHALGPEEIATLRSFSGP